jgi:hypothetical protein
MPTFHLTMTITPLAVAELFCREANQIDPCECVDHVIALSEQHLLRVLKSYASYYNSARTHRSLDKDAPVPRPVQPIGRIVSHALVGGLHHQYARI